jgi:small subunit ribosomal protein S8
MAMNDLLSDMIARIRNGQMARLAVIKCPHSKLLLNVLAVLKEEGFVREYREMKADSGHAEIEIELKYDEGQPVIREIKRVSKSGRRTYSKITKMPKVHNGLGISILSTSKGVVSDFKARHLGVGGEVLCKVF